MQLPLILQRDLRTRLIQGVAVGSVLTMVIGFGFAGWQLQGNAERRAGVRADAAVVAALAPICVEKFKSATDAKTTLVALNATDSGTATTSSKRAAGRRSPATRSPTAASPRPAPRFSATGNSGGGRRAQCLRASTR